VGCKSTEEAPSSVDPGYHETAPPPLIDSHTPSGPVLGAPSGGGHGIVPAPGIAPCPGERQDFDPLVPRARQDDSRLTHPMTSCRFLHFTPAIFLWRTAPTAYTAAWSSNQTPNPGPPHAPHALHPPSPRRRRLPAARRPAPARLADTAGPQRGPSRPVC